MYREPSGKRQRASAQERANTVMAVALAGRERVFGLSAEQAKAMPESSALGRLRASREISMRQYEAGARYQGIARDYAKALGAKGLPQPGDLNRSRAHDGDDGTAEDYVRWCRRAIERHDACARALGEADRLDRHASTTVRAVVIADWLVPYFVPALRVGLNALAHVLQIPPDPEPKEARIAA